MLYRTRRRRWLALASPVHWQAPSHWKSVHTSGSITVNQTTFIPNIKAYRP